MISRAPSSACGTANSVRSPTPSRTWSRALGAIAPHDWRGFLRERVDGHAARAPLDGFARAGWRLVFRDTPSAYSRSLDAAGKRTSATFSLGLSVAREGGRVIEVVWGSPAYQAGLALGSSVVAVNGRAWRGEELAEALRDAKREGRPIELLMRRDDRYSTVRIDYREGPRFPHLERIDGTRDRLGALLKPREAPR